MEEIILKAALRTDSPKKVRLAGLIPGVLNESDLTSTSVQFETSALNKIILNHGTNAKIWVTWDKEKKFGFIKEIQRNPVDRKIIHIAVQLVSKDQEVKMEIPISFHGREELEHRMLQIQVYKGEIEVTGKTALMPDVIIVDVSEKVLGDTITTADLKVDKKLKTHDADSEIFAVIKAKKEVLAEEPAAAAAAPEATPA